MATLEFTDDFRDALQKLPPDVQDFIKDKLAFFSACENPLPFAKKLKGVKGIYRFRIGNYRAVFRVERSAYIFFTVKDRKDVYQGLSL